MTQAYINLMMICLADAKIQGDWEYYSYCADELFKVGVGAIFNKQANKFVSINPQGRGI